MTPVTPVTPVTVLTAATAQRVVEAAAELGLTIGTAESLTGGLVAARLTGVPGASAVFAGSVVSYATAIKQSLLGVEEALVGRYGVVSAECAEAMASGALEVLGVDLAVSTTGVAGPDRQEGKAPGQVHVAVAYRDPTGALVCVARKHHFAGGRAAVRTASVDAALAAMAKVLTERQQYFATE